MREYDLSQAKSMNNGLLFPMLMLYFLHFKMGQVQPLFFQTINGLKDFLFSPLVQVHVLGKNLERPFKNKKMEDMKAQADLLKGEQGDGEEDGDGEEEEEVVAEEESDGDSSDASDSEDEYDEESEQQSSEEYDEYDSDEE